MAPTAAPERPVVPTPVVPPTRVRALPGSRRMERLRGHRVARRWRYRLAPDPLQRRPKGVLPFWSRMRAAALVLVAVGRRLPVGARARQVGLGDRHRPAWRWSAI